MKHTLVLSMTIDIPDEDLVADWVIPALSEYCVAVQVGDAGRMAEETYEAQNGVEIEAALISEEL